VESPQVWLWPDLREQHGENLRLGLGLGLRLHGEILRHRYGFGS